MPDYKALYEQLFCAMTDAIEILRKAQIKTVDTCIDEEWQERNEKNSAKINAAFGIKSKQD